MMIDNVPAVLGELKGKVAVITGAGRGIGREAARALARMGAAVVIAEVQAAGAEVEAQIRADGGEALFVRTDVADEASVTAFRDQVMAAYGRADILINNATVFTTAPLWQHTLAEWDRVMAVNLRGAFLCIRAFLPQMLQRRSGVVVTMESAEGMPYLAPYLASKVGLRSLALSLAQEVGEASGVSVYCYGAGMVDTPGLAEALERLPELYGLSNAEFIRQSGVSLISAEACGTGLAGTVLYASEFHGQQTGFSAGLSRLGLMVSGEPATAAPAVPAAEPVPAPEAAGSAGVLTEALALNLKLEEILRGNIREYEELTMFQRPLVKRMFQQGTGLKVEEWLAMAQAMTRQLERLSAGQTGGWTEPLPEPYVASLKRMAKYIRKQETDARGFFRNQEVLNRALQALNERHSVVAALAAALEHVIQA